MCDCHTMDRAYVSGGECYHSDPQFNPVEEVMHLKVIPDTVKQQKQRKDEKKKDIMRTCLPSCMPSQFSYLCSE